MPAKKRTSSLRRSVNAPKRRVSVLPKSYAAVLEAVKERIRTAQLKAALAVNSDLVMLYWSIGREIMERQDKEGWGSKVVERLANDLHREFPGMNGLSERNLKYMRALAEAYPDRSIVQQAVARIPWGHNVLLLTRVKKPEHRLWYAQATIANGWSRAVLDAQVATHAHRRQGKAITNFKRTLPAERSDLAHQTLKDPYTFEFLGIAADMRERDLEQALVDHIQKVLLELGSGFAFVGRQVPLKVGRKEYKVDLLFYHLKLRCYVVVDLKMEAFEPEHAGKMNFYLTAVDAQLRHPDDKPSIGLLLCKDNDKLVVEYALRDVSKPIGVAEWKTRLVATLPKNLRGALPSVKDIERELSE
ncbi:MAG TPA: PDDEXK nuclease domain-containing protein [Flavobacteriales bacterium]|nr:PDDEXK nuclease domain-containing protein [Flavobacteriales bacterium]HMR27490.1 PDDEXK nuclease domain-containing protein [Flavobacteriales bacterium]